MGLKYNEDGCLSQGIYRLSLSEFEDEFVKDKSKRRMEILKIIDVI